MWGVYSEELHDGKVGVLGEKSGDFYGIAAIGMALIQSGASPILPHHGDAAAEAFQCLLCQPGATSALARTEISRHDGILFGLGYLLVIYW